MQPSALFSFRAFSSPDRNSIPIKQSLPNYLFPKSLVTSNLLSTFIDSPILDISYKQNSTICGLAFSVWLLLFCIVFKVHHMLYHVSVCLSFMWLNIPLFGDILFYPFICWWNVDCCHILCFVNGAMNIWLQVFLKTSIFIPISLEMELLCHRIIFNYLRNN